MTPTPSSPAAIGMAKTAGIATSQRTARRESPEVLAEEATTPPRARVERVPHLPTAVGKAPPAELRRDWDPDGETWTPMTTWDSARTPTHLAAEDALMVDHLDPRAEDRPEDRREEDHPVDPHTNSHQTGDPLEDRQVETPPMNRRQRTSPRTSGDGSCTSRGRSGTWSVRRR